MTDQQPLSKLLWLGVPLLIITAQILIEIFVPHQYLGELHSENGPHETLQFILAALALVFAFRCLFAAIPEKQPLLTAWIICFCLGCAYIAGEEISWGQHVFEWGTSEFWSSINDQNETNLHNTSSWLDQKPRLILLIGVVMGGLVIPSLQKLKPALVPTQFSLIYPPSCLSVTAAFALGVKVIDKIDDNFEHMSILSRASEVEELYLFYFVLLYLIALRRRIVGSRA